jgi:SNF2 family DNA or RNA helicase
LLDKTAYPKMPIRATPYEHQTKAYEFALDTYKTHHGVAFLMEMGTGKTLTTIGLLGTLYQQNRILKVLIVAPKTIVSVWNDEFAKFADYEYNLAVLDGAFNKKADVIRHMRGAPLQVIVVNYESCWRLEEELAKWQPDFICCDESSKIKNPQAKCSKALHRLGKRTEYNLILTGTPVVNNPLDFFSQYKFLDSEILGGSYYAFRAKHAILGGFQNHQIVGYNHLDELVSKVHDVAYRVKLADAVELPDYIDETREFALEPRAKQIYDNIEYDSYSTLFDGEVTTRNVLTRLLRLSQVTGGFVRSDDGEAAQQVSTAKLDVLEDILDTVIEEGKKVVIFARFIPEIRAIEKLLKRKQIGYALVCGEVKDRAEQVSNFQINPDTKAFVGQLQTTGMGLTLTAASVAVFYSLDFNFANYEQSRARIHRIGQDKKCLYIHLVAKGTVDQKILQALQHKGDVATLVVDEWRKLVNG